MVLTFLSDFNKRSADLWKKKKFVFNRTLEVNVDKGNSISWEGKHVLKGSDGPDSKVTMTQEEKGLGKLKVEWGVAGNPKFTLNSKELADDLEVELCVEGSDKGNVEFTYGQDPFSAKCNAQYADEKMVLDTQLSFAYDKVTFGLQGVLDTQDGNLSEYNVGVRLDQDADRTYALRSQDKFNELNVAFYYQVSKDSEIGTQIDVDMGKGRVGIQAGGSYKLDSSSKLRYNLNSKANLGLAYEYKFNKNVSGAVGCNYSLTDNALSGPVGYKLTFDC